MNANLLIKKCLHELGKIEAWKNLLFYCFRTFSVFTAILGFTTFVMSCRYLGQLDYLGVIGALVMQATFLVGITAMSFILWTRSNVFFDVANDNQYPFIRLYSHVFKIFGECYSFFIAVASLGGTFGIWVAGTDGRSFLSILNPVAILGIATDNNFIAGLSVSAIGIPLALFVLFTSYLLAETSVLLADIAINTHATKTPQNPTANHRLTAVGE
jgi:hypothetical protein